MEWFAGICRQCGLGELVSEPAPLFGGLMHKMYGVVTDRGKYAVKLLNPHIMLRKTAKGNFEAAERLEEILGERGLPILPARSFGGRKMQELEGQYFYVFDWYDGRAVRGQEIRKAHCARMGKALAKIHEVDRRASGGGGAPLHIDWMFYLDAVQRTDREIFALLEKRLSLLYKLQERGNRSCRHIPAFSAICHNDMDSKNVLWKGMEYRIIDLECLSYSNPLVELLETALNWSGFEECSLDLERFRCFTEAYAEQAGGPLKGLDWESLYDSNNGRLLWLEYNLKRMLGIEGDASEKRLGRSESVQTLEQILYYDAVRETVLNVMA